MPLEDISQLVGHVSTSVTETVYQHEIRPALTKGAAAMDSIFEEMLGALWTRPQTVLGTSAMLCKQVVAMRSPRRR